MGLLCVISLMPDADGELGVGRPSVVYVVNASQLCDLLDPQPLEVLEWEKSG